MVISGKRVWLNGQFYEASIEIIKDKISRIYSYGEVESDIDYGENRIVAGFIDVHTHGAYGFDTNDAEVCGLKNWINNIAKEGVTSILPTTVTQSKEVLTKALKNVAKVYKQEYTGAEILGIHFEGPFLNQEYKGAQPKEYIVKPSIEEFEYYQSVSEGLIKYITLACEEDVDLSLTRYAAEHGVVVSQGHSSATFEQAQIAIANGATSMTHVFNRMSPLHHRDAGLVGAALADSEVYGEIIADGEHIHFAALRAYMNAKGRDYAILVTDSLCAKYCGEGDFKLGGYTYKLDKSGVARLEGSNTIAGSTLSMNKGLQNLVENVGVSFGTALNACTINPARCLRVDNRKGKLVSGYDADIIVLDDKYNVLQTYCRGKAML
jgi:N-acetylglucosamine-6-phosphate deacetylase